MEKNLKIFLSVLTAVVIIILLVVFLKEKPTENQMSPEVNEGEMIEQKKDSPKAPLLTETDEIERGETAVQQTPPKSFPVKIDGTIVGMTNTHWIIEQSTGAIEIGFSINTPVYNGKVSNDTKATVFDVKAGTKIEAELDSESGNVKEAVIVE